MKTWTSFLRNLTAAMFLMLAVITGAKSQQTTVIIPGIESAVVQYDTGSATKFYSIYSLHDIGRKDGAAQSGPPQSKNDIFRCGVEFELHGSGIMKGSTINAATLIVTIGGVNYNAIIKGVDTLQSMTNPTNLWNSISGSSTTYFTNVPYGSSFREYTSTQLTQGLQNCVHYGKFKIGVMSQSESTNDTQAQIEISLRVTYTPPPAKISVRNSFGGGVVTVDAGTYASGAQFTWTGGTQHTVEAIDQEYPATQYQAFASEWIKIVGITRTQVSMNRTYSFNAIAGEMATLEAEFTASISVTGTFTVQSGQIYTITPKTIVNFAPGAKMVVNGTLIASGKADKRITFTSPTGQSYQGIEFNGAAQSTLEYCDVNYASTPIKATNTFGVVIHNVNIGNSNFSNGVDDAAMSFYNSVPCVRSVTVNGQAGSLNGARFAQGSRGSLSYSTIANCGLGNGIILEGNSSPTIAYNIIANNGYHGILLNYNAGGFFQNNSIDRNGALTYSGIYAISGGGYLEENVIEGFENGVFAADASSLSSSVTGSTGKNRIYGNTIGLKTANQSYLQFGVFYPDNPGASWGWCNQIHSNTVAEAAASGFSTINARGNFWGYADPPPANKFIAESGSSIDYTCHLLSDYDCYWASCGGGCDPCGPSSVAGAIDYKETLDEAALAEHHKDFDRAVALYEHVLSFSNNTVHRTQAMVALKWIVMTTGRRDLVEVIRSYSSEESEIGTLASICLMQINGSSGDFQAAKQTAWDLRSRYPNSNIERRALTFLASLRGFSKTEQPASNEAISVLKAKYGSDLDAGFLAAVGGGESDAPQASQSSGEASGFSLSAYPNPFNPTTTISFTLPEKAKVELKVYDALGRMVIKLLNGEKSAGSYQVDFDASLLPTGVYFYRLDALGKSAIKKLLLVK